MSTSTTTGDDRPGPADGAGDLPASDAPWFPAHKVEIPDAVRGYVEREELEAQCAPGARRLTVLHAPGGFGKTALLAQCCRRLRDSGTSTAWLSVDEDDSALSVASYLSVAFQHAGVAPFGGDDERQEGAGDAADAAVDSAAMYRVDLLLHAIRRHGARCVLAVDELDRLQSAAAVDVLNAVLQRAPRNLSVAMAFRQRPRTLDIAMFMLEGRGRTLAAEDLRFSNAEVASFFRPRLSGGDLESVVAMSAGWPIALCLYRNALEAGTPVADLGTNDTIAAWIDSRLWRGLRDDDRDFMLEVALFDWIDPGLIDEATGRSQSRRRLAAITALDGLLQTAGGDGSAMRLHPLIREYCATRLFREDPARFRAIHVRIARALARRGHVQDALRHASEAGDKDLVGAIAEETGGIKLWIRQGTDALRGLDEWLSADVVADRPRLALVRCVALTASGDMEGAGRVYQAAAVESVGFTQDRHGVDDEELRTDHLLVLGMFAVLGCSPMDRYKPLLAEAGRYLDRPDLDPLLRGMIKVGLAIAHNEMASFDTATDWADSAHADLAPVAHYLLPQVDFQLGITAMARGDTAEAERRYERGLRVVQGNIGDTGTIMMGAFLKAELDLERSATIPPLDAARVSPRLLNEYAAWFDAYAASLGVATELAWHRGNPAAAVSATEQAVEYARATDRVALARLLCAQRVSLLVRGGRLDDAERAWRADRLPVAAAECLDLSGQRWREMEAIASARVRLLTAHGDAAGARELAAGLCDVARERSLARTLMRGLVLSARLEREARDEDRAVRHLADALCLYRRADYARPLGRERAVVAPLLDRVIDGDGTPETAAAAREVRAALGAAESASAATRTTLLSAKERRVLRLLATCTDRAIAGELEMSYDAVRYYVRKLFAKLDARSRDDAVHRARALGLLPNEDLDPALRR
ncbi:MAG: LuxR C-terminal-related transcriptional regulator [Gammaproteobacteria bacterium]|nr:LuxR C-terminal-related transcriptional regulator [Gammaproteobacteria bacterium]